jgi:AcrR family transcriptional regulator
MVAIDQRIKHKEQIRESILETTKIIVLQEGWQAVSIRKIADSIGYSLPMVYKFFEN